jgi:hypothetical protein
VLEQQTELQPTHIMTDTGAGETGETTAAPQTAAQPGQRTGTK